MSSLLSRRALIQAGTPGLTSTVLPVTAQPVVIDNKPGANSIIGVDAVAKAAPDGYTLGVVIAALAANTTLCPELPYSPTKDLVGVSLMGVSPLLAAVNNNAPFKNAKELVDYSRAKLDAMGTFAEGSTPEACDTFIATETTKWAKVIKDAGVTLE